MTEPTAQPGPAAPAKAQPIDAADLTSRLDAIKADAHTAYADNPDRLAQLDSHLATVAMVIEHMADEAGRASA